jgi:hypothetical protein
MIIQTTCARRPGGEERVAQHPRRHADRQHPLHAEPREQEGHGEHEQHLGHLAERLRGRDVRHVGGHEVELRVVVVRRQRDADEQRARHEHVERPAAELPEGVEPEDAARRDGLPRRARRRVREREAVDAEQEARHPGRVERQRRLLGRAARERPSPKLMNSPAMIHPIVPHTRMRGNCRSWSSMWWNASELDSPSVGM